LWEEISRLTGRPGPSLRRPMRGANSSLKAPARRRRITPSSDMRSNNASCVGVAQRLWWGGPVLAWPRCAMLLAHARIGERKLRAGGRALGPSDVVSDRWLGRFGRTPGATCLSGRFRVDPHRTPGPGRECDPASRSRGGRGIRWGSGSVAAVLGQAGGRRGCPEDRRGSGRGNTGGDGEPGRLMEVGPW